MRILKTLGEEVIISMDSPSGSADSAEAVRDSLQMDTSKLELRIAAWNLREDLKQVAAFRTLKRLKRYSSKHVKVSVKRVMKMGLSPAASLRLVKAMHPNRAVWCSCDDMKVNHAK